MMVGSMLSTFLLRIMPTNILQITLDEEGGTGNNKSPTYLFKLKSSIEGFEYLFLLSA